MTGVLRGKPSFPQGKNCILHFDAIVFADSMCIRRYEGLCL